MSDDLTPGEHADLRARLLTGAKRIKPVGRHRTAWVASTIAVVLVAGLTGGAYGVSTLLGSADRGPITTPAPTPDPTAAPTTSATPIPSPEPTRPPIPLQPAVAFDGDCARVLSDAEAAELIGPVEPPYEPTAFNFNSDVRASAALLGGIVCGWASQDEYEYIGVSVYPAGAVVNSVRDTYADAQCSMRHVCEVGKQIGDFWVSAGVDIPGDGDFSEEAMAEVETRALSVIDIVAPKLSATSAQPTPRTPEWWSLRECDALTPALESIVGAALEPVFPGDAIPSGLDWDVLVGAGIDQWCPWSGGESNPPVLIEVITQPGIGAPASSEVVGAQPIDVAGADLAWYQQDQAQEGDFTFVAVRGPNRVLVRYFLGEAGNVSTAVPLVEQVLAELG